MSKIDFSQIQDLLVSSTNFSISETQYKKLIGRAMPKDASYLTKRSAIARFAAERGLAIRLHEKSITFEKIKGEQK